MPATAAEVYVPFFFRRMGLPAEAVEEILHLKTNRSTPTSVISKSTVNKIAAKESLRRSSGEWNEPTLDNFLKRTAKGLSDDERRRLTHIGAAEQDIIDRYHGAPKNWQRSIAHENDASPNGPGYGQNLEASAIPPLLTTGFTPINRPQPHERPPATVTRSSRRPRHEPSPDRDYHYQTSESSTATNFPSPYGPSGNNDGRPIDNQPAHNSATLGRGRTNAGPPFQRSDYPCGAPNPHSDYHRERSDRAAKRRSTGPPATSAYPSTAPSPKGPRDPGRRDDIYC